MRPIDSKAPVSEISDKIISILRAGILAPSTHNTQPWLFEVNHNSCKIYVDPKLTLKEADPDGRNLYISIGCLLENIDIAARQYGLKATFRYFRQTKENLVATVSFDTSEPAEKREELFNVIAERYTYRGNFDKYRIDEAVLKELITINNMSSVMLSLFDKKDDIKSLAKITHDSLIRVANKKSFRIELAKWMNSSYSSKKDGIPGYAYGLTTI